MYSNVNSFTLAFGLEEAIALSNLDTPTATTINSAVIQCGLEDATAEINAYLQRANYPVPLPVNAVPLILRRCCNDIARYRLDKNQVRDDVRQRYEDAIAFLKDLVRGTASLGAIVDSGSSQSSSPDPDLPLWSAGTRIFTRESLKDY